ncbi:hypothetical protein [Saccharibacillus kuerlensis]|uniref:Phospholipase C/D domain-containing protein n=1 Tax=Saccharibacillus kuerlensis TaxID=459527 RepID=A0ABQ2KTZ6_9BACL|nr:hypothetical protein [Saccharibacillus kuerlensis]GGN91466.1 hypothetical protein GCM10010969_03180 [Saccharibacillus kuerlensis]
MPWPMVHFAISQQLYSGSPTPNLLLGSIAPDAVHIRGDVTREEKGLTHLVHEGRLAQKKQIFEKLEEYLQMQSEPEWIDFIVGYFTHIYTDLRWTETLYTDFEKVYKGDHIREAYKNEVSQIEFELQKSMNNILDMKKQLVLAKGYSIYPFVTEDEVKQYRDLKLIWLNEPNNEPKIQNIYFTTDKVKQFILETTKEVKENLRENNIEYFKEGRNIS